MENQCRRANVRQDCLTVERAVCVYVRLHDLCSDALANECGRLFAGDWDSGKTILLVDLAAHVAYGLPWLNNRTVSPRPVIYYALEAGDDVSKRLCATSDKLKRGEGSPLGKGNALLTNLARCCAQAGASLRDVQRIAGHADLGTTERYVEPSLEAQRRLIALT